MFNQLTFLNISIAVSFIVVWIIKYFYEQLKMKRYRRQMLIHATKVANNENQQKCAICLCKEGKFLKFKCQHEFHEECALGWMLISQSKCPICLQNISTAKNLYQ